MITSDHPYTATDVAEETERRLLYPPIAIAVLAVWVVPLATSLELDETGVWWVVKDGIHQALTRARVWPLGQSLLYDALLCGVRSVAGGSDLVMRLPSVLAMLGALYLLYRLGERWIGRLGAMFACLAFVTMRDVVYVASTMRPYALVPLFVIGAVLALQNWLDSGKRKYATAYVVLAALGVHASYFAALMLPVHGILVIARWREHRTPLRVSAFLLAWLAIFILILPLAPLARSAAHGNYSYLPTPDVEAALKGLVPPLLAGALGTALLISIALRRVPSISELTAGSHGWFLATWALFPITILFLVSLVTSAKLFAPRYFVSSAPAVALLIGALICRLKPRQFRLAAAAAVVFSAVFVFDGQEGAMRGATGWRGAAEAVRVYIGNAKTPVLAVPSFHEGATLQGALDPTISDAVFAPYLRYDFDGQLIRVPQNLSPEAEAYLDNIVSETLAHQREFFLVGMMASEPYREWLRGRCAPLGFTWRWFGNFQGVGVSLFTREEAFK